MGTQQFVAGVGDGPRQSLFHLVLRRPALLIGRQPQVAAGHQQHLVLLDAVGFRVSGNLIFGHAEVSSAMVEKSKLPISGYARSQCRGRWPDTKRQDTLIRHGLDPGEFGDTVHFQFDTISIWAQ